MAKLHTFNTLSEAAEWLSAQTKQEWDELDLVEAAIKGRITLLASNPAWKDPGIGELQLTRDGVTAVSLVSDGLIRLNDSMLDSLLKHGRASLGTYRHTADVTVLHGAPEIHLSDVRVARTALEAMVQDSDRGKASPGGRTVAVRMSWVEDARSVAKEYIQKHRDMNLFPSQGDVSNHVATELRAREIYGHHGKPLEASYVKRNAISGEWWRDNKP